MKWADVDTHPSGGLDRLPMFPSPVYRSRFSRPIAVVLGLVLATILPAHAALVETIGEVRIIKPLTPDRYRPVFPEKRLRKALRRFLNQECDAVATAEEIGRRYRFLGYVPSIHAECDETTLHLTVRESSHRIELITFDPDDLRRIEMTADPQFKDPHSLYPVPRDSSRALLRGLLRTVEGDLYNAERYRTDSEAVGLLGYAVAFIPGPDTATDAYPAGAYLIQSLVPRGSGRPVEGARTNYIGGSASYGPREKGAVGIQYQKRQMFGQFDRFSFSPTYGVALGGDMTYTAPILSDREDPRRLYDLQLSVFSIFRNNRNLAGVETDERRTGAAVSLGLRPLGIRGAHDLRFRWRLEHTEIDLDEMIPGVEEVDLTILRSSAAYEWRHTDRSPSLSARIVPVVELAFDDAGGARNFVRSSVDTGLHGRSRTGFEFDLHLNAGTIDRSVPTYELWDLGGATTVRGFTEDSILGRHRVALQTEIWIPFTRTLPYRPIAPGEPISQPGEIPIERRSARLLKWALFADGGYISGTTTGRNESLFGAGLGLRFVVPRQPLVIRLDYGWGLGGRGYDSFAYVSLVYRF